MGQTQRPPKKTPPCGTKTERKNEMQDLEIKLIGPSYSGKTFLLGEIAEFLTERGHNVECFDDGHRVDPDRRFKTPQNLIEPQNIKISTGYES